MVVNINDLKRRFYLMLPVVAVLAAMPEPVSACTSKPDTLIVSSAGENNRVTVNLEQLEASGQQLLKEPVQGSITQTGKNNKVRIRTHPSDSISGVLEPSIEGTINQTGENNRVDVTDWRVQSCTGTRQESVDFKDLNVLSDSNRITIDADGRNRIRIIQSGTNNSVKINSR